MHTSTKNLTSVIEISSKPHEGLSVQKNESSKSRREFLAISASTALGASALSFPLIGGAEAPSVKIGVLHSNRCQRILRSAVPYGCRDGY